MGPTRCQHKKDKNLTRSFGGGGGGTDPARDRGVEVDKDARGIAKVE